MDALHTLASLCSGVEDRSPLNEYSFADSVVTNKNRGLESSVAKRTLDQLNVLVICYVVVDGTLCSCRQLKFKTEGNSISVLRNLRDFCKLPGGFGGREDILSYRGASVLHFLSVT